MKRTTNILDRIGSLIPGYIGYAKRDNQRISDKLLRNQIAARLVEVEEAINEMQKNVARGQISINLLELEELRKGCSALSAKIKNATYGNSALFDKEQIKEEELQELYRQDELILDKVNDLNLLIQQEQEANFLVTAVRSKLKDVGKAFSERTDYLQFKGNK